MTKTFIKTKINFSKILNWTLTDRKWSHKSDLLDLTLRLSTRAIWTTPNLKLVVCTHRKNRLENNLFHRTSNKFKLQFWIIRLINNNFRSHLYWVARSLLLHRWILILLQLLTSRIQLFLIMAILSFKIVKYSKL